MHQQECVCCRSPSVPLSVAQWIIHGVFREITEQWLLLQRATGNVGESQTVSQVSELAAFPVFSRERETALQVPWPRSQDGRRKARRPWLPVLGCCDAHLFSFFFAKWKSMQMDAVCADLHCAASLRHCATRDSVWQRPPSQSKLSTSLLSEGAKAWDFSQWVVSQNRSTYMPSACNVSVSRWMNMQDPAETKNKVICFLWVFAPAWAEQAALLYSSTCVEFHSMAASLQEGGTQSVPRYV